MHRILCVDDDPASLRTLVRSLSAVAEVDIANSPEEARALCIRHSYSVVLTDYNMPSSTGVELLESLAALGCRAVPLLVTGQTDIETAISAVNRGHVYGLVHKPWRAPDLAMMVKRACERFELSDQLRKKIAELEAANHSLRMRNEALESAQASIRQLTEVAATDDKTGARTHRFFAERLEEELARARRYARPLGLMLLDLDGFKSVNDTHGHIAGDGVLRGVADVVRGSIRVMDVFARYGGDEFAVILPDTGTEGAACLAGRLCDRVRESRLDPADKGTITLSLGIAALPDANAENATEFLDKADRALYRAKTTGKDRVVIAESSTPPGP